jgi:YfiH family protein
VVTYDDQGSSGAAELGHGDAIVTARAGVLLAVTVADCVPVFMVDPERRLLGLAHAGWRGAAAGVVESALEAMRRLGADELYVHLGPAICGRCYEVGPEVAAALGSPSETRYVDLRAHLAQGVVAAGVDGGRLTASSGCTRCESASFFSYRGGDRGRRMCAFLGWRAG